MRRQVALLIQSTGDWQRQVLRGVANYAHEHGGWDFYIEPRGNTEGHLIPADWHGDGILCRLDGPEIGKVIQKLNVPAVNMSWLGKHSTAIPKVVSDEAACGIMAGEHFLSLGFAHMAYVRPLGRPGYGDLLGQSFASFAKKSNVWHGSFPSQEDDLTIPPRKRRSELAQWLSTLPRPIAILVWNSEIGRELTAACNEVQLKIPDDVAILCSEHDLLMSSLATIPLSNIDQTPIRVGYLAAELLDAMMNGAASPQEPILVPPFGIVQRQSTDTLATDDPLVAAGVQFIRDNCHRPIQVIDVQKALKISRRVLESRFAMVIQRSPAVVIRRARLERVKRLLVETDLPISVIAEQTGFNHPEVLTRTFRREVGVSPVEFRKRR